MEEAPATHWIGGYVDLRTDPNTVMKIKFLSPGNQTQTV